jgi:hypothetical protein
MGNQRPARQIEGQPSHTSVVGDARHGPGHIDERDIAHGELHTLIVLVDRRMAGDLKHNLVMVPIIKTNILVRALEPVSIATDVHSRQSAHAQAPQPTGKGVGLVTLQGVPPV